VDGLCAACGAQNPAGSRFCGTCGASLVVSCVSCGAVLTGEQRFCNSCGTPVDGRPPPPSGERASEPTHVAERRVCSVMFADLVGFTPLSESRDAEEVRELLSTYFERTRTVVERYGGIVEKFIGDAVMAAWGMPVAVEGDAERAVRAAMDIVTTVELLGEQIGAPDLRARAGIVTGEVAITVGLGGEGMAGDSVNTAARVQTAATPGAVFVDEATYRLTRAAIEYHDTGGHQLKGKSEPMRLWQAARVVSGVGGAQRVDGLEAPLLGRDAELRTIKELFHASAERRSARLVVVSGPAGVGKSRLGWEFEKYVDGLAAVVWWHRGRCLSYGDGVAFWALAEIVRQRLGIAEDDPTEVAAAKLADGVSATVSDPETAGYIGVRLGRLLGVPVDGDPGGALSREELFAGWRLFFEQLAGSGPVVLLVEDAQHADSALLDFVDHVVDWARDVPIFVLVFGRSELLQSHPGWGVGQNRTVLALDPLDASSMDALVDALVPGMPDDARTAITRQSQGIPLFAMETIRSLIDRDVVIPVEGQYRLVGDVGALEVPDSLRGLLAARLDALSVELRSLVADAAVLGTTFPAEALAAIAGREVGDVRELLNELQRRGVVEVSADRLSPQRGFYRFTHSMLRQVAYESQSRRDRKRRHLAVAANLRTTFAGDGDEVIDVVAQHYRDALSAVPGDSDAEDVRAAAIDAYVRGAERALRAGAPRSAAASFAAAARLREEASSGDGRTSAAPLWERSAAAAAVGADVESATTHADHAIELYRLAGDERGAARCDVIAGRAWLDIRQLSRATERLRAAFAVLEPNRDAETVMAMRWLATAAYLTGGADADELTARALVLGQELAVEAAVLAELFSDRGVALGFANRSAEAIAHLKYAAHLAEQADDGFAAGRAYGNLSSVLIPLDPAASAAHAQQGIEFNRRIGSRARLAVAYNNLCMALLLAGRWDEAETALRSALAEEAMAGNADLAMIDVILAALQGRVEEATATVTRVNRVLDNDQQARGYTELCAALIAEAYGDRPGEVLEHAQAVLATKGAVGVAHELIVWAWPLAARAAWLLRDGPGAAQLLAYIDEHPAGHLPPLLRAERELAAARDAEVATADGIDALFESPVAALRRFGSPYHVAHALIDQAQRLGDMGVYRRSLLDEARQIAERFGAEPLLARVEACTAALGQPSSSSG
jgi:class 3 adenylate cyclase/tetratricopeptide (TPR) repeat protein